MALVVSLSSHQVNMVTHNPYLGINIIVVIQINGIKPSKQNLFMFVKNEKNDNTSPICFNTLHVIIRGKHVYQLRLVTLQVGTSFPPNDNHVRG